MPAKQLNGRRTATIDEVVELQELGNLAEDWAALGAQFDPEDFDRYKVLCGKYSIDSAGLLYVYQAKRRSPNEGELTGRVTDDEPTVITGIPVEK